MENKELLEKARQANSPEELLALAKENGYPLDEEGAKAYFEQLHTVGELSDDELDNVAGGGCYNNDELVVTVGYSCSHYVCNHCGKSFTNPHFGDTHCCSGLGQYSTNCKTCKYRVNRGIRMICTHPANRKGVN